MFKHFEYGWPALTIALAIFYLSCLIEPDDVPEVSIENADKIMHFLMYFGLSLITSCYYILLNKGEIKLKKMIVFAILIPVIYGGIIEILQEMYFDRSGDWFDFVADLAGCLTAIPAAFFFRNIIINYHEE